MGNNKVSIIGAGNVGSAIANALTLLNIGRHIVLFGIDMPKQEGEAWDIQDCVPLLSEMEITPSCDYEDLKDSDVIVVTVGVRQKEDESRLHLLGRNAGIIKSVMKDIDKAAHNAVVIIVSNPVDILTRIAIENTTRDENKIFGSGTLLDTSRLRYQLGKLLNVNKRNVHVHVVGEHGDSEFIVWSNAYVSSIRLDEYPLSSVLTLDEIKKKTSDEVRNRAYNIISRKGYTNFGIAVAVSELVNAVLRDEKKIYNVSVRANKDYGIGEDAVLSLPCVIGKNGVEKKLLLSLNDEEQNLLKMSAKRLNEVYLGIDFSK
ncbi:MAG: L-lactate dehydrogenase [Thermodesulfovibrionales bacterium]|nr:L-lactate dehydrogenase [Thermodesulfovibrionales bacterium]